MTGSQSPSDAVLQFSKVVGSSIATDPGTGKNEGLLYSVAGIGGVDYSGAIPVPTIDDDMSERDPRAEAFGQLGFLSRPLPPNSGDGENRYAEALCMRSSDGLVPMAYRDTRIRMPGTGPGEGTIAMVGYGGGFLSYDPIVNNGAAEGDIQVLYCPYNFSGGVAQKAHAIVLDPTSGDEAVSVVHGSGMAITMHDDKLVLKSPNGMSYIEISDAGVTITAPKITLSGGTTIGNPSTAVPLLAGVASPASTMLWVSP